MPRPRIFAFVLLLLLGGANGCNRSSATAPARRIVCTTAMIGDIAQRLAGPGWSVQTLMGSGVDPHLYRPTRTDVEAILSADLVLTNGLMLEGRMGDALSRAAEAGRRIVAVADDLPRGAASGEEDHPDPHVWMDPVLWRSAAEVMKLQLIRLDPAGEAGYHERGAEVERDLSALHDWCATTLATIPASQRILVTAHDAFHYLGARYGLEVTGIQGISTESEAGVQDIERLVDLLVERKIGAIFIETTVAERNVRALIDGAASRGHTVALGGELFSDAMGAPGTYEGSYVGMIDHNVTTITRALGGTVEENGRSGRLKP